jgi:hypothetical protein
MNLASRFGNLSIRLSDFSAVSLARSGRSIFTSWISRAFRGISVFLLPTSPSTSPLSTSPLQFVALQIGVAREYTHRKQDCPTSSAGQDGVGGVG